MKKFIVLMVFGVFCSMLKLSAQNLEYPAVTLKTSLTGGRYEMLQTVVHPRYTYLLDKHDGRVWLMYGCPDGDDGSMEELSGETVLQIQIEEYEMQLSKIDTSKINYQLYLQSIEPFHLHLINIHSGETWSLGVFVRKGVIVKRVFKKILTPE